MNVDIVGICLVKRLGYLHNSEIRVGIIQVGQLGVVCPKSKFIRVRVSVGFALSQATPYMIVSRHFGFIL